MDKEIWKDIEGYEGLYQVSNMGRVRSLLDSYGNQRKTPKTLKNVRQPSGYFRVCLSKGGIGKRFFIHRLVAQAFIPNPENKPEVNHIVGDKANNTADNLEWNTRSENIQHALKNNLRLSGENCKQSKLTVFQVNQIRKEYIFGSRKYGASALAKKYGVTHSSILKIIKNKTYKDID